MNFVYDDGGRKEAGFEGAAGDCVCRSIAIASGLSYAEVYGRLNNLAELERPNARKGRARGRRSSARNGVFKSTYVRLLQELGFKWTPTMQIGSGCKVHLRANELPAGRLVVSCSKHLVAVIDGVIHDTYDPSREGTRCVYGYWKKE